MVRMLTIICCVLDVTLLAEEMVFSVDCDEARFFGLSEQMEEHKAFFTTVLEFQTLFVFTNQVNHPQIAMYILRARSLRVARSRVAELSGIRVLEASLVAHECHPKNRRFVFGSDFFEDGQGRSHQCFHHFVFCVILENIVR